MDWQDFIDFIDSIGEYNNLIPSVQVFVAGVTAFATVVLAFVTQALVGVTKKIPYVVCFMESSLHNLRAVNVMVKNTGNAAAFDIKVNIIPALPKVNEKPLERETKTKRKVSILAPMQSLSIAAFEIKETPEDIKKTPLKEFNVIVSWASTPKGQNRETIGYTIGNIDDFRREWTDNGLHEIHRELELSKQQFEKTAKQLERIADHLEPPKQK